MRFIEPFVNLLWCVGEQTIIHGLKFVMKLIPCSSMYFSIKSQLMCCQGFPDHWVLPSYCFSSSIGIFRWILYQTQSFGIVTMVVQFSAVQLHITLKLSTNFPTNTVEKSKVLRKKTLVLLLFLTFSH